MSDGKRSPRTEVIVALITLVGVIATGLFANWEKIFPPRVDDRPSRATEARRDAPRPAETARPGFDALPAPMPKEPECGSTIRQPPENHFLILGWQPVENASTYNVEVDCFGCREFGRTWHSLAGAPWHIRSGLGLRTPIYSSKIHVQLREAGGLAIRWRVWAVDHDGKQGRKSDWCQLSFFGG